MTEDYSPDSMYTELNSFLLAQARQLASSARTLIFKLDYKNTLKITDADKKSFEVQENFLQSFRNVYTDKSFKYIRVHNWQFQFEFQGKKCAKLTLVSDQIAFIANKNNKKQLKDVTFRVHIAGSQQIAKFPKQVRGYLNRIGKRHLVNQSQNMAEQFFSLMSFSKAGLVEPEQVKRLANNFQEQTREENPIQCLNNDGKKIIQKLKHFISRQNIFDFMVRQELSTEGQTKLSGLINPSTEGKSKKKVKA